MQFGYNHNIRHKGKTYHIQTEDSGKPGLHITTLLYCGGTILSSKKASYAELVDSEDFKNLLREMMKLQHKQMLIDLKNGIFDDPEQAKLSEPEDLKKEEDKTILDAIAAIEEKKLKKILTIGAEKEKDKAVTAKKEAAALKPAKEKKVVKVVKGFSPDAPEIKAAEFIAEGKPVPRKAENPVPVDDSISEKSLDEVILNYLSQDLKKKGKEKQKAK